ncbi:MAG: hypothetical protein ACRECX_13960 [Methyloceanibacter sp.]|uniref:hypothetical protein n=1 Tax=Methyloceanibacter sp. TaxID=1965321 RepID=UPI003D6D26CA
MSAAADHIDSSWCVAGREQRVPWQLVAPFAALHLLMFGYDLSHPDRFLNADRATERMHVIKGLGETWQSGGGIPAYLTKHGIVGDWLPQALLYLTGGQYLVIAVQVLLVLLSIVWVRDIGLRLGLGSPRASAAAALYGILPHSLVFPHQLASEAISVPLVILSFAVCVRAMLSAAQGRGGLAMGLATLVRPVTMAWPVIYAIFAPIGSRARIAYLIAALAPLVLWMGLMYAETGVFSMGQSGHDLSHNLYGRAMRMTASMPAVEREALEVSAEGRMSLSEYARFVIDHPGAAAAHSARDLAAIGLKSGVERIVLDYLDLFPQSRATLQDPEAGWRAKVEQEGAIGALADIFRQNPGLMTISIGGSLLFAGFMICSALGALVWLREKAPRDTYRFRLLLIGFALYIAAMAQAVDAVQSRQRAPAEFALCLMAVAALPLFRRRRRAAQPDV